MNDYEYPAALAGGHTRAEIIAKMQGRLSQERFEHCLRVEETSRELAVRFGVDVDLAGLTGLLHDYAKEIAPAEYRRVIVDEGYPAELLNYNRGIWHGVVGTWFIQTELNIAHPGLVRAINRHTTGHPQMTKLDMIVFVADYIEPDRKFESQKRARAAAQTSLETATLVELQSTLAFLISKQAVIYPLTMTTYNAFVNKEKK